MNPRILTKEGEREKMILQESGYYETDLPPGRVPKFGTRPPRKKKFTLQELKKLGWNG